MTPGSVKRGDASGSGAGGPTDELVVVHVKDAINATLAGHGDVSYQSPPLPREEARMLVRLLLGAAEEPPADQLRGTRPIAGGQRTITLEPLGELDTLGRGGQPVNGAPP